MKRRQFLSTSLTASAPLLLPSGVRAAGVSSPNAELNLAGIGIGGMGGNYLRNLESENIVALCDVDSKYAAETFARYPKAKRYVDFRVLLETEKAIDGVVVGTPDHTHAVIVLAALQSGKHVYCAKPLTRTVAEARQVAEAAAGAKVATQMSIQWNAKEDHRLIAEWIADGAIGDVREVHTWSNRPIWPQGIERPAETPAIPETLNWDLWLGPAPKRPYHSAYHPFNWRGWWDFGCGALGDMGCHHLDPIFRALQLSAPLTIEAETSDRHPETAPKSSTITYHFPERGERPPVKLVWYDGGRMPERPEELEPGREMSDQFGGTLYVGSKGKLLTGGLGDGPRLIPESAMQAYRRPERTLQRSPGHYEEFVLACKGGPAAGAAFDYGARLTETALLGNVAIRAGHKLEWDAAQGRVTNHDAANAFIEEAGRVGW